MIKETFNAFLLASGVEPEPIDSKTLVEIGNSWPMAVHVLDRSEIPNLVSRGFVRILDDGRVQATAKGLASLENPVSVH